MHHVPSRRRRQRKVEAARVRQPAGPAHARRSIEVARSVIVSARAAAFPPLQGIEVKFGTFVPRTRTRVGPPKPAPEFAPMFTLRF